MCKVIAVGNNEKNSGKTTTTISLATNLKKNGKKVLVIDTDKSFKATKILMDYEPDKSIYDVLMDSNNIKNVICHVDGIDILPSSNKMENIDVELFKVINKESLLKNIISEVIDDYDYILIDCPASVKAMTVNALVAANKVIIPIQCNDNCYDNIGVFLNTVKIIQCRLNIELEIQSILLTNYDKNNHISNLVKNEINEHFDGLVSKINISKSIKVKKSLDNNITLCKLSPTSKTYINYREFTKKLLQTEEK